MFLLVLGQIHIEGVVSHARAGSSPAFAPGIKWLQYQYFAAIFLCKPFSCYLKKLIVIDKYKI
jgi:hypothetical protein